MPLTRGTPRWFPNGPPAAGALEIGSAGPRRPRGAAWGEHGADTLPSALEPAVRWIEAAAVTTAQLQWRVAGTWALEGGTPAWRREHAAVRRQTAALAAALPAVRAHVAALPRRLAQDAYRRRLEALNRRLARAAGADGEGEAGPEKKKRKRKKSRPPRRAGAGPAGS